MFRNHNTLSKLQFGGSDGSSYRIAWFKFTLAIILMIATGVAMNLRDHNKSLYTGWSLFGLAVVVIGSIIVGVLLHLAKKRNATWPVFAAFALGIVVAIAFYALVSDNSISLKAAVSGVVTFAVISGCLIGIGLTKWWWPERRP